MIPVGIPAFCRRFWDNGSTRKGQIMSKYFMQDTHHAAFERMMMSVPLKRDHSVKREHTQHRKKETRKPPKERTEQ